MRKENRTEKELWSLVQEHIQFLVASCKSFDEGYEPEAKRLAVSLRVLLHDTGNSNSLLGQLGIKNQIQWLSTIEKPNPKNLLPTHNYVLLRITSIAAVYKPILGDGPHGLTLGTDSFTDWWTESVHRFHNESWSRKDFVLWLANKEGGAHVDPHVVSEYQRTASPQNVSLDVQITDETDELISILSKKPDGNLVFAGVRQVAFEVLLSLKDNLPVN